VTAASCLDHVSTSVPRGGSVAATTLPATRGALDECLLVGTDAPDMSALVGASSGTVDTNLRTKNARSSSSPLKSGVPGENATYLKLEKPRFLFREGSEAATTAPVAGTAALTDAPAALACAYAVHVASSADCPAAGTSAPTTGIYSSTASAALGDGGGGCRMDLPGPTTSVGTRTDYSVGPWDYPACATRHLKAWSTRTAQE
jgi:hypothetical protein